MQYGYEHTGHTKVTGWVSLELESRQYLVTGVIEVVSILVTSFGYRKAMYYQTVRSSD